MIDCKDADGIWWPAKILKIDTNPNAAIRIVYVHFKSISNFSKNFLEISTFFEIFATILENSGNF